MPLLEREVLCGMRVMGVSETRTTVVVITHNRRAELLRTLDHMCALPDSATLIVVDNASTDGTADAVAAAHPEVELVRSETNLGAIARNVAVDRIDTPYVAFCDDDTTWQPGSLDRAADVLDQHPQLAAVMARILVAPGLEEDPITPELRNSPLPAPPWLPGPALLGVLAGATTFRAEAFRAVGGFLPQLWLGGEEELLMIDLFVRGWWACWREDVILHHAPSTSRDPTARRRLGIRNTLWTTWLRRPVGAALRRTAAVLASAPKDRHTAAAVLAAVRGVRWVARERRVVPPEVEARIHMLEDARRHTTARQYVG